MVEIRLHKRKGVVAVVLTLMAAPGKLWVPDRRDMIWIDFNPQVGGEMKAEHPMLVLSTQAFNQRTGLVIGLP